MKLYLHGFVILFSFLLVFAGSVNAVSSDREDKKNTNLDVILKGILKDTSPWTIYNFPFEVIDSNQSFQHLYNNSCLYVDEAVELVGDGKLSPKEVLVLSHVFYSLPLGEYLDWMLSAQKAYKKNKIPKEVFGYVIFPALTIRPDLYFAYKNDEIKNFYLNLIKYGKLDSNQVKFSRDVVNGNKARWLKSYLSESDRHKMDVKLLRC